MKKIILLLFTVILTQTASAQWKQLNFPSKTEVNFIKIKNNTIFAATRNDGIYISKDNGVTWETKNKGIGDVGFSEIFQFGDYLFLLPERYVDRYYYTIDNGENWIRHDDNFRIGKLTSMGTKLIAATNSFLMISSDTGKTWQLTSPPLNIFFEAFATKGNTIYALAPGSGFYTSTDNGENWGKKNSTIDKMAVREMIVDGDKLYAIVSQNAIYVSTDDGNTWDTTSAGRGSWTSLVGSGKYMFAGNFYSGVTVSTNHGANWKYYNEGLTNLNVRTIAIDGDNVYAGTDSGGVFRAKITDFVTGVNEEILLGNSLQISPQPSSDFLQVKGINSTLEKDNIQIFNLLGESLIQEPIKGTSQQLNISALSPGIYYLKIANETKMFIKK